MATDTITAVHTVTTVRSKDPAAISRKGDAVRARLLNNMGIFKGATASSQSAAPNPAIERKMKIIRAMGLGGVIPPKPPTRDDFQQKGGNGMMINTSLASGGGNESIRPKIDFSKITEEALKYTEYRWEDPDGNSSGGIGSDGDHTHLVDGHEEIGDGDGDDDCASASSSSAGSRSRSSSMSRSRSNSNASTGDLLLEDADAKFKGGLLGTASSSSSTTGTGTQNPKPTRRKPRISFNDSVSVAHIPMRSEYSDRVRSRLWSNRYEIHENATRNAIEFQAEGWDWRSVTEDEGMFVCTSSGELIHPVHCQQ